MQPHDLQAYLHDHIPLSRAMQVSVLQVSEAAVVLEAPLAPNINHRNTVFGGSASALAILSAWSLLHFRLHLAQLPCRLVIQRNNMSYDKPIAGDFTASATLTQPDQWAAFMRMLTRKGKARITITSVLEHAGTPVGVLTGEFVALRGAED